MNTVLLLIILVPILEIYLFIKIGSQIGAFTTISLIFVTAIIGIFYARYEGLNTLKSGISQLYKNQMPLFELMSGAALAFAALLLILPGFATDLLGFFIIFPAQDVEQIPTLILSLGFSLICRIISMCRFFIPKKLLL